MADQDYSFDWAIAPQAPDVFLSDYFEQKPMVIRRDDPTYYSGLLTSSDIDRVVSTMGLSAPEITVTQADKSIATADYAHDGGVIDPVRVAQLFADGATVILSGLHERLPSLAQFCRAVEAVMSCQVQTNIYMTPARSQGFKAHYDAHDVLVLQVEGTKEWRIYDTPVELPLRTQRFDPETVAIGDQTDSFVLGPGDMAYIPRGLTHDAVSTDQLSLHITTGLMFRTWADVLFEAVNAVAHKDPALRRALPPGYANAGFDAATQQARFDDLWTAIRDQAPLGKLMDGFRQEFLTGRVPRVSQQMTELAKLDEVHVTSVVGARPHLIYDLTDLEDDGQVRVVCQGAEILLPDHAREPLAFALSTPSFRIADMPGDLDDAGKLVLVRRLVREGLMVVRRV
ncbi:MAG: cupin domain-containing protein [Pseudomonadota bacterium]